MASYFFQLKDGYSFRIIVNARDIAGLGTLKYTYDFLKIED